MPALVVFRMMEDKLDLKPSDLWMIGDSYKHDITGAINAGWHSLWINRRFLPDPEKLPDISVLSDSDLITALAKEFT